MSDDEEITKKPKKVSKIVKEGSDDEEEITKKKKSNKSAPQVEEEKLSSQQELTLSTAAKNAKGISQVQKLGLAYIAPVEDSPLKKPQEALLRLLEDKDNDAEFILYKGKRLLHKKILKEFVEIYGKEEIGSIIKCASSGQRIIFTDSEEIQTLQDSQELKSYLSQNSMQYASCVGASELARGGEAVVFRVEHFGLDEIVAKCTIFDNNTPFSTIKACYSTLFYETQTLKMLKNPSIMAEIKEEIIELNPEKEIITRYCVIVEKAQKTLGDVIETWMVPEKQEAQKDFFTPEKLTYYFFQAMKDMQYCHRKNLFYGDMKAANILVFRDQRCKLGDLGISIRMNSDDKVGTDCLYELKGATPGYLPLNVEESLESGELLSKNTLYQADTYSLNKTFDKVLEMLGALIQKNKDLFDETCQTGFGENKYPYSQSSITENRSLYFMEISNDLKLFGLDDAIAKWERILQEDSEFQIELASHLLDKEYKYQGVKDVLELSRFKQQLQQIEQEFNAFKNPIEAYFKGANQAINFGVSTLKHLVWKMPAKPELKNKLQQTLNQFSEIYKLGGGEVKEEKKQEELEKIKQLEREQRNKRLQEYLCVIEEDYLRDIEELKIMEIEEEKQPEMYPKDSQWTCQGLNFSWGNFYGKLSSRRKEEWRKIINLLVKTYDSDKTNELFQNCKEVLIQNEQDGHGNLYFGRTDAISHTNLQSLSESKTEVLVAVKEDTRMFEHILEYLLLTSNETEKIWFPLKVIFEGQPFPAYQLKIEIGLVKSFLNENNLEETLKYGKKAQQDLFGKPEYESQYLMVSDMIMQIYFQHGQYEEAMKEIQTLKAFLKEKHMAENNFDHARFCWIEAQVLQKDPSQFEKYYKGQDYQPIMQALQIFRAIFGENSYYTLMAYQVLGESLYTKGPAQQEEALKYFLKCYSHPSVKLKLQILRILQDLNSQQLPNFIKEFQLNDPFEVVIEEEIQLVARECLFIHFQLPDYSEKNEEKKAYIQWEMIKNATKVSELFSKVKPLYSGCLSFCGQPEEKKIKVTQHKRVQGLKYVYWSDQEKYAAIERQLKLEYIIRDLEKRLRAKDGFLYKKMEALSGKFSRIKVLGKGKEDEQAKDNKAANKQSTLDDSKGETDESGKSKGWFGGWLKK